MAEQFTPPPGPVEEFPTQPPVTPKKSNTTMWIIIAAAVVLLCCCCVAAVVLLYNYGDAWFNMDIDGFTRVLRLVV